MQSEDTAKPATVQEYVPIITSELELFALAHRFLRERTTWATATDPVHPGSQALADLFGNAADDLAAVIETMQAGEALLAADYVQQLGGAA